jgi:transcriptional regulator with XRE-family HTH domain
MFLLSKSSFLTTFVLVIISRSNMASIGNNIKEVREQKGLMQNEVASAADMQVSNYSKINSGQRDISVESLAKISQLFGMTVDGIIFNKFSKNHTPVKVEDKSAAEIIQLISKLDEDDKNALYAIIDGMLPKNEFQTFFEQTISIK